MASEELRAVFTAVETISDSLENIGRALDETDAKVTNLSQSMSSNTAASQAMQDRIEQVKQELRGHNNEAREAITTLQALTGSQNVSAAAAATQAGAMRMAENAIDEMGDEALTTGAEMTVLGAIMDELALSGSALSVNIGAFNVSLRNLAPLVPIIATLGSAMSVLIGFVSALVAAGGALSGFMVGGAVKFASDLQEEFDGITSSAEAMQAIMGGMRDLFAEALEPLTTDQDAEFFVNTIEGFADFVNRFAQATDQMRDVFMPLFSGIGDIINQEFDSIANGIEDMMDTMTPLLLDFFEFFAKKLPGALRFFARITDALASSISMFSDAIFTTLQSIIGTATAIFQGLVPAFSVALDTVSALTDLFSVLSNGILQATLFLGGLILAATKFVGIADTLATVTLKTAQQIRNAGGIFRFFQQAVGGGFESLTALGKVITGEMSLADASGETHRRLAEEIQETAESAQSARKRIQKLHAVIGQLTATVKGADISGGLESQFDEVEQRAEQAADEVTEQTNRIADGLGLDRVEKIDSDALPSSGGAAFRGKRGDIGGMFMSTDQVAEEQKRVQDAIGSGFDQLDGLVDDNRIRFTEVIGGFDANDVADIETDDVARAMAIEDLKPSSLAETFRDNMFNSKFKNAKLLDPQIIGFDAFNDLGDEIDFKGMTFGPDRKPVVDLNDEIIFSDQVPMDDINAVKSKLSNFTDGVVGPIKSNLKSAGGAFATFSNNAASRLNSFGSSARTAMSTVGGAISNGAKFGALRLKELGGVTGVASKGLQSLAFSGGKLVGTLKATARSAVTAGLSMLAAGAQAVASSAGFIYAAFSQLGVRAGFIAIRVSAMGAISALASAGATALATAATFIASLIPAAISAGTVINVAFVGIPAILGAIAIAAGLVVGVLGNMDKVTASAKGAFDGLKNGIRRIGSALLTMAVPAFNLMVDIVGALLSPFFALAKGIGMVAGAFGLAGGEGSLLGGIINMLFSSFEGLMTVMGGIFKVLSTVFGAIGDIIFSGFLIPFQLIAGTINFVKTVLSGLFSLALQKIPFLSEAVGGVTGAFGKLVNVIKSIPSFFDSVATIISSTIDNLVQGLQDLLEPVVNAINEVISKANQLPGVNLDKVDISGLGGTADQLEGAKVSAQDVRENTRRRKKEPGQDVATEPNVNLSLEDSVENNVEVQAEPEDKAKISRLTKDALEEANSFARRRQGG